MTNNVYDKQRVIREKVTDRQGYSWIYNKYLQRDNWYQKEALKRMHLLGEPAH